MDTLPTIPWPSIMLLTFYILLFSYSVFTAILYYHWQNYSTSKHAAFHTYIAFFVTSVPLIIIVGVIVFLT